MQRTKEALLAQRQVRPSSVEKTTSFSFTQLPPVGDLQRTLIFLVLAVALVAVPFLLPDLAKPLVHRRIVNSVSRFTLDDPIHHGQFKRSARAGDTRPSDVAAFYALAILSENHDGPAINIEDFADVVKQLEAKEFDRNAERIYRGVVQLKALGLLGKNSKAGNQHASKYLDLLISIAGGEPGQNVDLRHPSVSTTFYAIEAIKELGKLEVFRKQEAYKAALNVILGAKDASGGFHDNTRENATLTATWQAVQVLAEAEQTEDVRKALDGVVQFVYSTQAKDGGFLNTPVSSADKLFRSHIKLVTTAHGLFVLETLRKLGHYSPSPVDVPYFEAQSYLRSCVSLVHGVLGEFPSDEPDLEATYHFLHLVNAFPNLDYAIPRYVQFGVVSLGLIFALLAAYAFYSSQIPASAVADISSDAWKTLGYLTVAAITLYVYPTAAVFAYLLFTFHLAYTAFQAESHDNAEGFMLLTAVVNTFAFICLVFGFNYMSPYAFASVSFFYGLVAWNVVITLLVTLGSVYFTAIKKIHFFICASYLSWVFSTVTLYAYLYGRGDFDYIYRLLSISGQFPLVFVVLPFVNLVLSYTSAATAIAIYYGGLLAIGGDSTKKKKGTKKQSQGSETEKAE